MARGRLCTGGATLQLVLTTSSSLPGLQRNQLTSSSVSGREPAPYVRVRVRVRVRIRVRVGVRVRIS